MRKLLNESIYHSVYVIKITRTLNNQLHNLIAQNSVHTHDYKTIQKIIHEMQVLAETAIHATTYECIGLSRSFTEKQEKLKQILARLHGKQK